MILGFKKKPKTISKHVGLTSELGFVHWPKPALKLKVFSTLLPALLAFDKTFEVFEERNILLVL